MLVMYGFAAFNHWDVSVLKQQKYGLYSIIPKFLPEKLAFACRMMYLCNRKGWLQKEL